MAYISVTAVPIIFSFERTGSVWSGHGDRFLKAWIILHILNAEIT